MRSLCRLVCVCAYVRYPFIFWTDRFPCNLVRRYAIGGYPDLILVYCNQQ